MFGSDSRDASAQPSTPQRSSSPVESAKGSPAEEFALGKRGMLVFFTLAVLTLMVALDGTSISVALPVCVHRANGRIETDCPDYLQGPRRFSH